jgi:hypothetical protein
LITQALSEKHRKEILGADKEFDIVAYLYAKEQTRAEEKKVRTRLLEEEKLKITESEETFKPKTNDYKISQGNKL